MNKEENILEELQSLWDCQEERLDTLAARPEAQPRRVNLRSGSSLRRRLATASLALVVVNLVAAVCAVVLLLSDSDLWIHAMGVALASVNAFVVFRGLCALQAFLRHSRARGFSSDFGNALAMGLSSVRQVAAVSVAAVMVLVTVSCSPAGDGYAMTKAGHETRMATISEIDTMLTQI